MYKIFIVNQQLQTWNWRLYTQQLYVISSWKLSATAVMMMMSVGSEICSEWIERCLIKLWCVLSDNLCAAWCHSSQTTLAYCAQCCNCRIVTTLAMLCLWFEIVVWAITDIQSKSRIIFFSILSLFIDTLSTAPAAALGLSCTKNFWCQWVLTFQHYILFCSVRECWGSIAAQTHSKYQIVTEYVIQIRIIVLLCIMNCHG
jgi:hypothetical protein